MASERAQANDGARDAPGSSLRAWERDSANIRARCGVSPGFAPLSSGQNREFRGLEMTPRVKDLLDCIVIERMVAEGSSLTDALQGLGHTIVDVSQSHTRRAYTSPDGVHKCLTTSSQLYSMGHDRVIMPLEMLWFQGYPRQLKIPMALSASHLKHFAGEGMCLPCLAHVLWAIMLNVPLGYTKEFNAHSHGRTAEGGA